MAKIKISKQIFDDDVYIKSEKLKINNKKYFRFLKKINRERG